MDGEQGSDDDVTGDVGQHPPLGVLGADPRPLSDGEPAGVSSQDDAHEQESGEHVSHQHAPPRPSRHAPAPLNTQVQMNICWQTWS